MLAVHSPVLDLLCLITSDCVLQSQLHTNNYCTVSCDSPSCMADVWQVFNLHNNNTKEVMFSPVCQSVCLSVNRITQKLPITFLGNFMELLDIIWDQSIRY